MSQNQYEPWKEQGISETEYWKKKYLEAREEISKILDLYQKHIQEWTRLKSDIGEN